MSTPSASRRPVLDADGRSRRRLVLAAATGAAAGVLGIAPQAARAQSRPEVSGIKLGFIALTDAAPLFVAVERGLFARHGMPDVEVVKQSSWGTTRDNLVLGGRGNGIDGAHILTPMPYLIASGAATANNVQVPMSILARLNLGGQGISVSNEYADLRVGTDAGGLRRALAAKAGRGQTVKMAMTFPAGTHDLWIRYWLAAAGIDPNRDLNLITVPPPQMVANMRVGTMDAFCVGDPWNAHLINQRIGYSALWTSELWANHPEKALAVRSDWVQAHPQATQALLRAVMEAQMWCEDRANRDEVAQICARRRWIGIGVEDIAQRLRGDIDYGHGRVVRDSPHQMRFWSERASYPFQSHDLWFLTECIRWGYLPPGFDAAGWVRRVNREDLWRQAARTLGVAAADIPAGPSRGVERFFDGRVFDPANPRAYLDSQPIKALRAA
jgi:nitrate/nitrite transport system substrate-binding protein